MWVTGEGIRIPSPASMSQNSMQPRNTRLIVSCVCRTPLATPVVPEVYKTNLTASGLTLGHANPREVDPNREWYASTLGGAPFASGLTTTTCCNVGHAVRIRC